MDYKWHYDRLMESGKRTLIHGYFERHHIIPKCLGGTDEQENIVELTPEEHFVAHQLLIKMYPDEPKLVYAAHMMTRNNDTTPRNNKLYGWIRRRVSEARKGRKFTQEHRDKLAQSHVGRIYKTGWTWPDEAKQKQSIERSGKPLSEEHKRKIGESQKGKVGTWAGRKLTEEHKQKLSSAATKDWAKRKGEPKSHM